MTLLYTSPIFLKHETGRHPEQAERLRKITRHLTALGLDASDVAEVRAALKPAGPEKKPADPVTKVPPAAGPVDPVVSGPPPIIRSGTPVQVWGWSTGSGAPFGGSGAAGGGFGANGAVGAAGAVEGVWVSGCAGR